MADGSLLMYWLDVVDSDSRDGARVVSVRHSSGLAVAGLVLRVGGVAALAFMIASDSHVPIWVPLAAFLVPNFFGHHRRGRARLTDPVLREAALRAACSLGTEVAPGRWRITGPQARILGRELVRLHNWWTPRGRGNPPDRDFAREQALLAQARPEVRAFMAAAPPALDVEPLDPDTVSYQDGQPWPVLEPEPWPTLPPTSWTVRTGHDPSRPASRADPLGLRTGRLRWRHAASHS